MPPKSMTGFASRRGGNESHNWVWEIRSVNGRGLDLRLRLPDWVEGLEAAIRTELGRRFQRGNISLTLKLAREAGGAEAFRIDPDALAAALAALARTEAAARDAGLSLRPASAAEVLALRGVTEGGTGDEDTTLLRAALLADFAGLADDLAAMRTAEGAALADIIAAQIDAIAALTAAASAEAEARRPRMAETLRENLNRVLDNTEGVDEARLAQELALIAVKADVAEEIDRLTAHVAAARGLLAQDGPVGRKLDFLTQEFNREANTLCAKAQAAALTRIGLDLKHAIDQMREQIQNVE